MDALALLKSEISKKRKNAESMGAVEKSSARDRQAVKKWRPRAEMEAERERKYYEEQKGEEEKRRKKRKEREDEGDYNIEGGGCAKREGSSSKDDSCGEKGSEAAGALESEREPPLSKQEVVRRLRRLKEAITLFGEDDWGRFNRLRDLELAKEEGSKGQKNTFQKKLREMEAKDAEDDEYRYTGSKMPQLERKARVGKVEAEGVMGSKEEYVNFEIRKYMGLWESEIEGMSGEERRTRKGRSLEVMYEETKDWLKPLYKALCKGKVEKKILDALKHIFEVAAGREYVEAENVYLEELAIGNAPWPMGATMVGIHARAAREKIGEDKIAHVMNDEETRKYIQGVKRLLTVGQRHFPKE